MFCHVSNTGVVLFYVAFICKESFGEEIKPPLADRLNAILSSPGWDRITDVGARYGFLSISVNGNASFTGKDLFVSDNLFVGSENQANTLVGDHDEGTKHYMVTHLLACVYVNATAKLVELLKRILRVNNRASKNVRKQARNRKKMKSNDSEKEENAVDATEGSVDLSVSWTVFNFAVHLFNSSTPMFDRMYSVMEYLIDTIPSDESFDEFTREKLVTVVLPALKQFRDKSKNFNLMLPANSAETDSGCKSDLGELSYRFSLFIGGQAKRALVPFLDNFCTVSEPAVLSIPAQISLYKAKYRKHPKALDIAYQFAIEISRLVHEEVCKNYYSELGFVYDIDKQTTSFPSPPSPPTP